MFIDVIDENIDVVKYINEFASIKEEEEATDVYRLQSYFEKGDTFPDLYYNRKLFGQYNLNALIDKYNLCNTRIKVLSGTKDLPYIQTIYKHILVPLSTTKECGIQFGYVQYPLECGNVYIIDGINPHRIFNPSQDPFIYIFGSLLP